MPPDGPNVDPAPRRPYNVGYRVSKVPLSYDDQVQLSAVLRVLYPYVRSDPKRIAEATGWLLQRWRARASQLAEAGWGPLGRHGMQSRHPNALGCPVAFVMTFDKKGGRKPCSLRQVCPFCWAREVRRHWLKIEAAFFPRTSRRKERIRPVDTGPSTVESPSLTLRVRDGETSARSPYDLVYRVFTFLVPAHVTTPLINVRDGSGRKVLGAIAVGSGLHAWLDSRITGKPYDEVHRLYECRALLKAAGPAGGMMEAIQYDRVVDEHGQVFWAIEVHQLLLAADGEAIPKALHRLATGDPRHHIVFRKPTHRTLAKWLGKTLRYPRMLLDPTTPIPHVIEHLDARQGRRLVSNYGRFRGRSVK